MFDFGLIGFLLLFFFLIYQKFVLLILFFFCLFIICLMLIEKNPIFSLFILLLLFLINAGLLFILSCDYFALVYLMLYLGAIIVLFIFSIMFLNIKDRELLQPNNF